jgi:hypothetical protein
LANSFSQASGEYPRKSIGIIELSRESYLTYPWCWIIRAVAFSWL